MKKWFLAIGAGAFVLTMGLTAVSDPVRAQETGSDATEEQSTEDPYKESLAANLGITVEELDAAIEQTRLEMIDDWAEDAKDRILSGESVFPPLHIGGPTMHEAGGSGMPGRHVIGIEVPVNGLGSFVSRDAGLDELAAFIGIESGELTDSLRDGMTISEIAEANGKTADELRTYLISQATEKIDERLQAASEEASPEAGASTYSAAIS